VSIIEQPKWEYVVSDIRRPDVVPLVVVTQDQLDAMRELATPAERSAVNRMVLSGQILVVNPPPISLAMGLFT